MRLCEVMSRIIQGVKTVKRVRYPIRHTLHPDSDLQKGLTESLTEILVKLLQHSRQH